MNICGIYTIICKTTGKIYVGQSNSIKKRFCTHKGRLRRGLHANMHLQSAWNKYGEHNFEFEILEECPTEFLNSQEHYWCSILNASNRRYGYNVWGTTSSVRRAMSEETKQKLRLANIGKKVSEETRQKLSKISKGHKHTQEFKDTMSRNRKGIPTTGDKRIPVIQYSKSGEFIKEWGSIKEASIYYSIGLGEISNVCKNYLGINNHKRKTNRKTAKGFIWKYKQS